MREEAFSKRLLAAASFVGAGSVFADVGADHAALSLHLLRAGVIKRAVLSDIRPLPLERAKKAVGEAGFIDKADFCLADGIVPLIKYGVDCIAVCGMGGETIASMLSADKSVFLDKTLIFQPMSKVSFLREFLWTNGFVIEKEKLVCENGRVFVVMKCRCDGVKRAKKPLYYLVGENIDPKDPVFIEYASRIIKSLKKKIDGIKLGGGEPKGECALFEELTKLVTEENK